jgi:hypothetical protein
MIEPFPLILSTDTLLVGLRFDSPAVHFPCLLAFNGLV